MLFPEFLPPFYTGKGNGSSSSSSTGAKFAYAADAMTQSRVKGWRLIDARVKSDASADTRFPRRSKKQGCQIFLGRKYQYCINECILCDRFANVVAHACTPCLPLHCATHLRLDMSCSHWFHLCDVHAYTVSFDHMWYKKMPHTFNN
jgi:hypothetical protein